MKGRSVTSPSGEIWTVRRCWMAKRSVRWRGRMPFRRTSRSATGRHRSTRSEERGDRGDWLEGLDLVHLFDENPLAAIGFVVVVILFAVLAGLLVAPLILAIVDLAILLVLTLAGLAARVVFRRPWEIEAVGPDGRRLTWHVVGWQRSRRTIAAVADRLARGQIPPTDSPHFPPR